MMHYINLGLIFVAGLDVGLAALIYWRNKRSKINLTLALSIVFLATWTLGIAMFREATTEFSATAWTWVQNTSGAFIVVPFFFFSIYFPYQTVVLKKWHLVLVYISLVAVSLVVFFSNAWIKQIHFIPSANDYDINFWGIAYFNLHFYFYLILTFYNLVKKYLVSGGFVRKQLLYTVLASFIIALFGGIFGAIIPLVLLRSAGPYYLGPYFALPMILILLRFMYKRD